MVLVKLLRPKQWSKNSFVIAPIFFARQFTSPDAWLLILSAALAFSFAAGCVYIFNDLCDAGEDRKHPAKCKRPIAAGLVSRTVALLVALCSLAASAAFAYMLPEKCSEILVAYIVLNVIYTLLLKRYALIDVFFIAVCFVLRVLMGCTVLAVMVSPWIILTTFLLALFLGFAKRYHEMGVDGYSSHRQNLQHYSRELLDKLVIICGASALVCYAIYTAEVARVTGDVSIVYTVIFVAFGLFRYLQSVYVFRQGGEPESVILRDKWQWVNLILWLGATLWALG